MLINERQQYILDLLNKNDSIKTSELAIALDTTRQTIHSDIDTLASEGKLIKVYGGAIRAKTSIEPTIAFRKRENIEAKTAIAELAASCIEEGDTIFLDIGTTVAAMIPYIAKLLNITIVTNSLEIAYHLAIHDHLNIIITGGIVRSKELSVSGFKATEMLEQLFVDKCFIGVGGLTGDAGFTDYHFAEADIRKLMITHAKQTYALLDQSKVGVKAIAKYADLDDVQVIVTDNIPDETLLAKLNDFNIEVMKVNRSIHN